MSPSQTAILKDAIATLLYEWYADLGRYQQADTSCDFARAEVMSACIRDLERLLRDWKETYG